MKREYRIEISIWPKLLAVNIDLPPRAGMTGWRFSIMLRRRHRFINIFPGNIYAIGPFVVWRTVNSAYANCPVCGKLNHVHCSSCGAEIDAWRWTGIYD